MPWAKIGLGLAVAWTLVSCSVIDGLAGSDSRCEMDGDGICTFCQDRIAVGACGTDNVGQCFDEWTCVRGETTGCGLEFTQMLMYFRANSSDCFNSSLPQVQAYLSCQGISGPTATNCFDF